MAPLILTFAMIIITKCVKGEELLGSSTQISGHYLDCSNQGTHCQNTFLNCLPNDNCHISCNERESCKGSVINCPLTGDCLIECRGDKSCQDTIIDASLSSGNFNLICDGHETENNCHGIKVYGSTLKLDIHTFQVICNDYFGSCNDAEIHCPVSMTNQQCLIHCNGFESCAYSNIIGPNVGNLYIECNSIRSCYNTMINGAYSSELHIKGCTEYKSCLNLEIYCPPNTNGIKHCFLEGNDNLGRNRPTPSPTSAPTSAPTFSPTVSTNHPTISPSIPPTKQPTNTPSMAPIVWPKEAMAIYAVNGWQDIEIDYSGQYGPFHGGIMNCGRQYDKICEIASNSWSCGDDQKCSSDEAYIAVNTQFATTKAVVSDQSAPSQQDKKKGQCRWNFHDFWRSGYGDFGVFCCSMGQTVKGMERKENQNKIIG